MFRKFLESFIPSTISDDEERNNVRLIVSIVFITFTISLIGLAVLGLPLKSGRIIIGMGTISLANLASLILIRLGQIRIARVLAPLAGLTGVAGLLATSPTGIHDVVSFALAAMVVIATIMLGRAGTITFSILYIATLVTLAILEINGVIVNGASAVTVVNDIPVIILSGLALMGVMNGLVGRLNESLSKASENTRKQIEANQELRELQSTLEERIGQRTAELNISNQRNEKRARQFEAIAQVARATTANEKIDELLPHLVSVISGQFGFYHTGIFLLDKSRENAILRAANSEGGKRMLARKHKLQVGQAGIVGFVSATGNPRIALDVGSDAVFFDNPNLPNTRSEMALPLRVAGEIAGVLDVQSTESNAFQQEDIEVLSTLADQVSIAIQNARSFEATQQTLQEAQKISSSYLQDAWRVLESEETHVGYRVSRDEIQSFSAPLASAHVKKAVESKTTVTESGKNAMLAVPIRLREEVIGIMDIHTPIAHEWDQDEVDIAEAVAGRLSLALESAILLKSTQRRAELERVTADISGKISASTQFDVILRTAAEELSRVFGGSEVLVQVQTVSSESDSEKST